MQVRFRSTNVGRTVKEIVAAIGTGETVEVVAPEARDRHGRRKLALALRAAGLSPQHTRLLGWGTEWKMPPVPPKAPTAPVEPPTAVRPPEPPAPSPVDHEAPGLVLEPEDEE